MGVQGLWELLSPVGRRVSVETLAGRKLAVDASIWMVQFMKAMRDDKGEMIRNAHLIGFFRRICKLLFLRVKPVFVFDGGTPALKRRTIIARRRQRERAQAKIRKTAEKLLLNHLRTRKLEELAQEIQNAKGVRKTPTRKNEADGGIEQKSEAACSSQTVNDSGSYEAADALLAASLAAEEDGQLETLVSESQEVIHNDESEDTDGNEEMILPVNQGKIDPAVLAVLPPSMQLDLLVQMREQIMADNRKKFQKVKKVPASFSEMQIQAYLKTVAFRREIEEVQKSASGRGIGGMPTSRIASESGREFIFSSSFTGDKQALHFPGSNMSEMEERPTEQDKHSDVSRASSSNLTSSMLSCKSVLQGEVSNEDSDAPVQTYVDEKGNIRVSRLRGMGVRMTRDLQWNLYLMKESEEQAMKNAANNDKNTDSNRTIQEQETLFVGDGKKNYKVENVEMVNTRSGIDSLFSACTSGKKSDDLHQNSKVGSPRALQISFTEDDIGELGNEDDYFAALVAGESVHDIHGQSDACNHSEDDTSECEWEEGEILTNTDGEVQVQAADSNLNRVLESAPVECSVIDGNNEVEWEIGNNFGALKTNSHPKGSKTKSRELISEDEELQEAIRRSLADFGAQKSKATCSQLVIRDISQESCDQAAQAKDHLLGGITYKREIKDVSEAERERKGKTLFTTVVDEYSEKCNSKSKGYIEKNSQIPTEKYESHTNHIMKGEVSSEICSRVSSVSNSVNEFLSKDPYIFIDNNNQPSDRVEKISRPTELNILNEIHENEQLCQTGDRETKNDNRMNALKSSEPVQNEETLVAQNITSMPEPLNDFSDKIISVNDAHDLYQDKVTGEPTEAFSVDDLIREAEETNSSRDRETVLKKEAELLEMKEENLRRKKEIEAELEAEKEALQANVDEEMVFLRQEEQDLQSAQKKHERNAESVTGEMFAECQELLQMFGLPYIIAPMEAEAQCAYLECTHLVDGVVTDDCDVFLFGAGSVYKNIFDERKYVETYFMKDVEEELGLNREKLIRMALLLGSDYTEGISGIGIVNAIEVVRTFHEEDGLKKFKEWVDSPDPSLLDKVHAHSGKSSRKKASKSNKKNEHVVEEEDGFKQDESAQSVKEDELSEDKDLALKKIFMSKHQAVSKNWHIPDSFPNDSVISAYRTPQVDKSTEPFSWGRPDLMSLRKLCWERFGWNKDKADELLLPVLKEYDRRETQLRLEAFYSFNERFAKIRSRRIQKAVTGITGRRSADLMDLPPHLESTQKRPRKKKGNDIGTEQDLAEENLVDVTKKTVSSDAQNLGSAGNGNEVRKKAADSTVKLSIPGRGRGKGKGRGGKRGAGKGHGRGRKARNSTDDSDNENEKEVSENGQSKWKFCADKTGLRKSTRPRKAVKYALDEQESNCTGHTNNDSDSGSEMSCEASEPKVLQKPSRDSASSFTRKGGQTGLESNLQETGFEIPDIGFRSERQYSDIPGSGGVFCAEELGTDNDNADDNANCTGDFLAIGGGFCVTKDNHEDDLHTNNDSVDDNANSTGDYVATGGGFCVEEDNQEDDIYTNNDNVDGNVSPTGVGTQFSAPDCLLVGLRNDLPSKHANLDCTSEGRNPSITHTKKSDFNEGENVNTHNEASPNETDGVTEKKQESHSSAAVTGLRAMPFLRRRKRT